MARPVTAYNGHPEYEPQTGCRWCVSRIGNDARCGSMWTWAYRAAHSVRHIWAKTSRINCLPTEPGRYKQVQAKRRKRRLRIMTGAILALCITVQLPVHAAPPLDLPHIERRVEAMPRLRSLLISQGGELIYEKYFNGQRPSQPANLKSASKSIISALVGIALEQGYLRNVDQPLIDFFPEYRDTELQQRLEIITVSHLLTMQAGLASTSGRNYGRWVVSNNWVDAALRAPLVAEPGQEMIYSTGSTHLLSAIIERTSGMSTKAFAQQFLATPLGFQLSYWSQDPQGVYFGGNDMEMTPRQAMRFGQLYLDGGRLGDTQIVAAKWVEASFQPRATSPRGQGRYYGYGWWLRDMAGLQVPLAWGYGGQLIFVIEPFDMVVVATSDSTPGADRGSHLRALYRLVEMEIIAPLRAARLVSDNPASDSAASDSPVAGNAR